MPDCTPQQFVEKWERAELKDAPFSKIIPATGDFAPRLVDLSAVLDRAMCEAYL